MSVLCVCVFVPWAGTQKRVGWRLLVEERIDKLKKLRNPFLCFGFGFWCKYAGSPKTKKILHWQTSLLCIVWELAKGGSVAVAVGIAVAVALGFIGFCATIRTRREIECRVAERPDLNGRRAMFVGVRKTWP